MKQILATLLVVFGLSGDLIAQSNSVSIIPKPSSYEVSKGKLKLKRNIAITTNASSLSGIKDYLTEELDKTFNLKEGENGTSITLEINNEIYDEEAYKLQISKSDIRVTASSEKGIFYGVQSLFQLIYKARISKTDKVQTCTISDKPRYGWRGVMLDESRHFFGKEKVKELLDMMALHKLNVFHWHLTDMPGWRIEIKKYPKLTTVGGIGTQSQPEAPAQFYTQEDIKEIVQYASERYIDVVPEIDMPGHATSANRAYPEFSGGGSERFPDFTFHPAKESTYQYLTDILRETASLFPSEYLHLGGDEVDHGNHHWKVDLDVKALQKEHNLKDLVDVERYFVRRMADSIAELDKKVAGWDEIATSKLNKENTLLMWWRHNEYNVLEEVLEEGYNTILCPRIPLYFDFIQHDSHEYGRRWNKGKETFSHLPLVYAFPSKAFLSPLKNIDKIKGIQANLWTERIQNGKRLDFMTYPRLSALAEAGWSNDDNKNYKNFLERLKTMVEVYKLKGITYFDVFNPIEAKEVKGVHKKDMH